jgi:hypothetical protein
LRPPGIFHAREKKQECAGRVRGCEHWLLSPSLGSAGGFLAVTYEYDADVARSACAVLPASGGTDEFLAVI